MREEQNPESQAERWFANLDLDGNGEITKQELFEGLRRRFEELDENRDRFISRTEYLSARKDRAAGQRRFGELDVNNDGRIAMEEFSSPADWRFDRIDRNLDGKISMTEAQRLFDRPVGAEAPRQAGECFYVDRQIVMVDEETAELYRNRGYPKADCQWTPDTTGQNRAKQMAR
ncbi:MAG: hypothetical protein WD470_12295 [Rhodospirillaceae bacterium]